MCGLSSKIGDKMSHMSVRQIRCFTCGSMLADLYDKYEKMLREDITPRSAMKKIISEGRLKNICCRTTLVSVIDTCEGYVPTTCIVKGKD